MSFLWPPLLLLLLLIPVGVWVYRSRERRRAERIAAIGMGASASVAGTPGSGGTAATASPGRRTGPPWTRRIPAACAVLGITVLVLSLARPQSVIGVPRYEGFVLLAFDVSGSMAAKDVAPSASRMEAAKAAALDFVANQPTSVRIGIVVFSDSGFATQAPTDDRVALESAIRRLAPERGTSLGRGIIESLSVIETALDPNTTDYYRSPSAAPRPEATPVPDGVFVPASIVLLTDGENTSEDDPLEAAQEAKNRGVRIDTVGIGSTDGASLEVEGFRVHTALDASMLQSISDLTGGTYYAAADQQDLSRIYADVDKRLVITSEPLELTALFAAIGFGLLVVGGILSLRWFGRMP